MHIEDAADGFRFAIANSNLVGNCFNLGYSEANLSKRELCEVIQKILPNFVYLISEIGEDVDKRNYKVSFDKITTKLGFEKKYDIEMGLNEMIEKINEDDSLLDYDDKIYSNFSQLKDSFSES